MAGHEQELAAVPVPAPDTLPLHRGEALTDGIYAVAMTLLVIELVASGLGPMQLRRRQPETNAAGAAFANGAG